MNLGVIRKELFDGSFIFNRISATIGDKYFIWFPKLTEMCKPTYFKILLN